MPLLLQTTLFLAVTTLCLLTARLISILPPRQRTPNPSRQIPHLLIVLGSGGHTAEMLSMLQRAGLDWENIRHRTWVTGQGDELSARRAAEFEAQIEKQKGRYSIETVPRAREIHQSLLTAPVSSFTCLVACVKVLLAAKRAHGYPDLILANGPATATILILASVLLRFVDWDRAQSGRAMRSIYVESWARVRRLSLSGRLLCWFADRILVQWEQLDGVNQRAEYLGVLV